MSESPTVVVLDSDPEARAGMEAAVGRVGGTLIASGTFGVEGDSLVRDHAPDVVLLGLEVPVERGLQMLRAIMAAQLPARVIVYSSLVNGQSVRQAMVSGASDFLPAPVRENALQAAFETVLARRGLVSAADSRTQRVAARAEEPALASTVVTVFGPKGGCGKTTIATNVAAALARSAPGRVALVDLSARFGDVALTFDIGPHRTVADAAREIDSLTYSSIRQYLTPHSSGVVLMPASRNPDDWKIVEPERIRRIIELLKRAYDFVVLDAPQAFTYTVAIALETATTALLVTSLDITSIKSAAAVVELLRTRGTPLDKVRLVVNHTVETRGATPDEVARAVGLANPWAVPYDRELHKGMQSGLPAVLSRPRSEAAVSLTGLTAAITGTQVPPAPRRKGLFGRFGALRPAPAR
jgi:pilus assembly protein CpaE